MMTSLPVILTTIMSAKAMDDLGIDDSFELAAELRTWSLSAACAVWHYDFNDCHIGQDIFSSICALKEPVFDAEYRRFLIEQKEVGLAEEYAKYGDQVNLNAW